MPPKIVLLKQPEPLRQAGHDLRLHAITHLNYYLEQAEQAVKKAGGHVHWARDAGEANRIVLEIARQHHAKKVVKSKSMATEEIGLNHAMEAAGIQVIETDLGSYEKRCAFRFRHPRAHSGGCG